MAAVSSDWQRKSCTAVPFHVRRLIGNPNSYQGLRFLPRNLTPNGAYMSGTELALTVVLVIAVLALLFAFVMSRREKIPRVGP